MPAAAADFLDFVAERHRIWERRQRGEVGPWTDDPILDSRKFTNVFRVLDHGSQFVLSDLIEPELEPEDLVARLFLYRHTGRVEAWEYLPFMLGRYPLIEDLDDVLEAWKRYRAKNRPIFTGAYLVFPQSQEPGTDKLDSIVGLTQRLAGEGVFRDFVKADSQADRFHTLRRNKGVADFMSMQVLTDYGYATMFRENDFVVPGPGARKGAALVSPGNNATSTVEVAWQAVCWLPDPPTLEGRLPSLMDVQNCLCEYSKYVRYAEKPQPNARYSARHKPERPLLPRHW